MDTRQRSTVVTGKRTRRPPRLPRPASWRDFQAVARVELGVLPTLRKRAWGSERCGVDADEAERQRTASQRDSSKPVPRVFGLILVSAGLGRKSPRPGKEFHTGSAGRDPGLPEGQTRLLVPSARVGLSQAMGIGPSAQSICPRNWGDGPQIHG